MVDAAEQNAFQIDATREGADLRLKLAGAFSVRDAASFRKALRGALSSGSADVDVDLSGVTYFDGGAASILLEAARDLRASGRRLRLENLGRAAGLLSFVAWDQLVEAAGRKRRAHFNLPLKVGENAYHLAREARALTAFTGDLAICSLRALRRLARFRWAETTGLVERSGLDALPIVILISTLLGLILAFLGTIQLERFGASAYMTNLVAVAMVRELGPIMTAILVAGRSGSGYAAELGSMAVDDEVDALKTMGYDAVEFLAVPRVLAVVISMPVLVTFSNLAGLVGGFFVAATRLELSLRQYLDQVQYALVLGDLYSSLIKATFFGILVAAVGCYKGLTVRGGAVEVGTAATSAVVIGIALVIAADGLFAIVTTYLP